MVVSFSPIYAAVAAVTWFGVCEVLWILWKR
jgi:hypothetical protein